ncbi:MarR family winged helix-turn-helix transcriptional regulator [Herbidospora sp. RD11066]
MTLASDPDHVLALIERVLRASKRAMEAAMAEHAPGLRGSFLRVMNLMPVDGIRLTDLARRASMTKQAMGEFVATLEQEGFVRVSADPNDRRVRIVAPTPRGVELQKACSAAIEDIEREWRERVGPRRWATARAVLAELAE